MKKLVLLVLAFTATFAFVSCGDENKTDDPTPDNGGGNIENSAFSVKYETESGGYEIYTISADRKQIRIDYFNEDESWFDEDGNELSAPVKTTSHYVDMKTAEGSFEYDDVWEESFMAAQTCGNYEADHTDLSKYYVEKSGFTEAGTETICGITCKKYVGTNVSDDQYVLYTQLGTSIGMKKEIVVANNLIMRMSKEDDYDGHMRDIIKAVALTTNVPAKAFTKTLDVDWIK